MSFLDKISNKLNIPKYFVAIMNRMSMSSRCALTALHGDNLREILDDFSSVVQAIGRDIGDPDHIIIIEHIFDTVKVRDPEKYVRPLGVKIMMSGKNS